MLNKKNRLSLFKGKETVYANISHCGDDLICPINECRIVVSGSNGDAVDKLLSTLLEQGWEARGCFNCRFFNLPGEQNDSGSPGDIGYCLEGKIGKQVQMGPDTTTRLQLCDNHTLADLHERIAFSMSWAKSIHK